MSYENAEWCDTCGDTDCNVNHEPDIRDEIDTEHEVTGIGDAQRTFIRGDGTLRYQPWGEYERSSGT